MTDAGRAGGDGMTDIVERLRNVFPIGWEGEMRHEAADEIERLRGALHLISYAEVEARVAAARREGIEAAIEAAMRVPIPEDASVAEAHGRLAAAQDICARIGALLTEGER